MIMPPDNAGHQRERALLNAALELPSGDRGSFLDHACASNSALRQRIEMLLNAHEAAGTFLASPAMPELPSASRATVVVPITEKAGDHIGRYKLLQQIGEGGCGVVYMAEQEEPVRRRVALKVIKLGMDTKQVIARFEAERQALALMDHPNIAKVLDAGATDTGRPYFVMELVRGVRITEYCDQNRLPMDERLKLFVQVCHAVQHAHQKGVIHRDIKPSNILVMVADEVPVPKMIDFGIAKAIGQRLTDKTVFTQFEQFIGTPAYMSPEQAGLSGLDVDTRSDLYALGVLLYELLTGHPPFEPKELAQAGLDEMIRRIREEEPPRPSTRLNRLEAKVQTTTAQQRATEVPKLIRSLRGDLDWIVMKCLEKNRTRRYETANDLARDVEYHLRHQPVSAAAPTLSYRAMKYVRRHRRVLATAGALVLMAVLGTTLSVWQARRAARAVSGQAHLRQVSAALERLPAIEGHIEKDHYTTAFDLVEEARPFIGNNPRFQELAARVVSVISVETTPPGADVFLRQYSDTNADWEPIGKSPLKGVKLPRGAKRWKVTLPGFEMAEGALETRSEPAKITVQLHKIGVLDSGMVRIQGEKYCGASLCLLDWDSMPVLELSDFLLDRYEVSNRRYKEFMEAGGYQKPDYWRHKFVQDGVEKSWAEAMKMFVDHTGKPGPATWRSGDFPKDQDDYPVGGISWYEAAAYAEWAGKRLPTVYHWSLAAGDTIFNDVSFIVPLSNFGGEGPVAVGACRGMTCRGIYDMAGSVKEWCFNEAPDGCRVNAGGGWDEAPCMFGAVDKLPPFSRQANLGFRCMKLLQDNGVWKQAAGIVASSPPLVIGEQKTCSDEKFQAYRSMYDYPKAELLPRVEATNDLSAYTRWEKVSFDAAYLHERATAYLFIPRTGKGPFQTIVQFAGTTNADVRSAILDLAPNTLESIAKSGRAYVMPFLRKTGSQMVSPLEEAIRLVRDFRRTLDYLETRPEVFDTNKLAYTGASWGAIWGGILPAIEPRIKVAVLGAGGFYPRFPEQYSQTNFTPRVRIPILLQAAKYDPYFPLESNQMPYLELFGTAKKDKRLQVYETGHYIWNGNRWIKDFLDFLDDYLGPANGGTRESADPRDTGVLEKVRRETR